MNTESRSFSNQGIKHTEGGWPKDVDPADAEHTIRYRKKVEKDEDYLRQVAGLGEVYLAPSCSKTVRKRSLLMCVCAS